MTHTAFVPNIFDANDSLSVEFERLELYAIPEPGAGLLLGLGLGWLGRRRR